MARPLFQLGPRLALCAALAREGRPLCDVGTDHALLPIWMLKKGSVPRALASDINPGPLEKARENARRYHVEDKLVLRLSDGLREIAPEEADEFVLAGMGGELILRIIEEAPWLRDPEKHLVLQPMSSERDLRLGLLRLGFRVETERAVRDADHIYTGFSALWQPRLSEIDPLFPWMGKLEPGPEETREYALRALRDIRGRYEGALRGRGGDDPETLRAAMEAIEKKYCRP